MSQYQKLVVSCSGIVAAACVGAVESPHAIAQTTTNNSNASGGNVTTITNPPTGGGGSTSGPSPAVIGRATTLFSNVGVAQTNYDQSVTNLQQIQSTPTTAPDTTPVRYGREAVGDIASCGCPNADVVGSNTTTERPELVAAKAAEAQAAAELAAAKAEARQFIESVKGSEAGGSTADSRLW